MRLILLTLIFTISTQILFGQEDQCERVPKFGSANICLPKVKGYTECYLDPEIKSLADATEAPANMVLGYYINDSTYQNFDKVIIMEDFFKVYGTKQISNLTATNKEIFEFGEMMQNNFIVKNWDEVSAGFDDLDLNVEVGVPTVIKTYKLNESSFSMLMLLKYDLEGVEPYTLALTINGLLSGDRIIWMAYYLLYNGESTIKKLEIKSNEILTVLQEASL